MLIRIPSLGRSDVRRIGRDRWRGFHVDPQFFFSPGLFGASFLVLDLEDATQTLDPRMFLYRKGDPTPQEIELRQTTEGLYVVDVKSYDNLRRIRFDPASYPCEFRLRSYVAYSEKSVRAFVGRRLRRASLGARSFPCCEIVAASETFRDIGARARSIKNVTEHFEQAIAMASVQFARAAPWPDERPKISFVSPVYDTPARYLDQLLESMRFQRGGAWELILSNDGSTARETLDWLERHRGDPSVRIVDARDNGGIVCATNLGLSAARGQWVGFIDHDDALAPFAVDKLLETIEAAPDAQFVYTDEIVADKALEPKAYLLKPAFDPVLLSGVNYVNHLSLYRRDRLLAQGGLRAGFDGSQDYDLVLRYTRGLAADEICHLPYPAYLWRRDGASFSVKFLNRATENARRALSDFYAVDGVGAAVEPALDSSLHRVGMRFSRDAWPSVSIVVPSRDAYSLVSRLFEDLTRRTDYPNLELIVVDNGTTDPRVLELYDKMRSSHPAFRAVIAHEPFNFSRQVNRGVAAARNEHVLLLNNDVEVLDPGWLKEMVSCLAYPNAGIVGARLLYPNGTIQHAGVIVGLGSVAGHWYCGMPGKYPGPMARLTVRSSFSAVTGACMLISRACLEATGAFDEENFAIAYNDVDFCLRAGRAGFRVVWTPFATLRHHESATRGSDETPANLARFRCEQDALRAKYGLAEYVDPAFNPWYSRDNGTPRLALPRHLPRARLFRV